METPIDDNRAALYDAVGQIWLEFYGNHVHLGECCLELLLLLRLVLLLLIFWRNPLGQQSSDEEPRKFK